MPFRIIRGDITEVNTDAIVNAANNSLLGGGGVDGCIHRAAGPGLLEECITIGGCATGDAVVTGGYNLPCRYVIHTVGPVWAGGTENEEKLLRSCWHNSLAKAVELGCESVAFPLISAGAYGYPEKEALKVATQTVAKFLDGNDLDVYLVIYSPYTFGRKDCPLPGLDEYMESRLRPETGISDSLSSFKSKAPARKAAAKECRSIPEPEYECLSCSEIRTPQEMDDIIRISDESFTEMLLRKIDESGMTDAQCYRKANIDRRLFSKIRSDRTYSPSKQTAVAFAVALELNLKDTKELLKKAGFALSKSITFDIIIEYCISHRIYDIYTINETLFMYDQKLLGV